MMAVATYTKSGSKATTPAKLDKAVFGLEVKNHELLKQAYTTYQANNRLATAKAKSRGEVSGGGRKPYRQKGTGRARFGSSRNPIWRGGGVAFGPTGEQNYKAKLTVKAKRQALRQALSLAAGSDRLKVVEALSISDGKTKSAAKFLEKLEAKGNNLIVVGQKEDSVVRAVRNLPNARLVAYHQVTVFDVLNADNVIIDQAGLKAVNDWLGGKNA